MKKALTIAATILIASVIGLIGGNIWGNHVREAEPTGFDIGSRITYLVNGITVGGVSGILIAAAWLVGNHVAGKKDPQTKALLARDADESKTKR